MSHNTWNSQASLCITEVVVPSILNCQLQLRQKYYSVYFCPGKPRLKIEKVIDYMKNGPFSSINSNCPENPEQ